MVENKGVKPEFNEGATRQNAYAMSAQTKTFQAIWIGGMVRL